MNAWQEWRQRWRDPITLFTLFLVIVGGLQWCTLEQTDETLRVALKQTDETLRLQQRAWLTPIGTVYIPPGGLVPPPGKTVPVAPAKNESINFILNLTNSGREPATDSNVRIHNGTVDGTNTKYINLTDIVIPENTTCKDLHPEKGRATIPPTGIGASVGVTQTSTLGEPRMVVDDRIISGDKFYFVQGCLSYLTLAKERHSSFCYILESHMAAVNQRIFVFVVCRNGFDAT
jgi:hypothetical protein